MSAAPFESCSLQFPTIISTSPMVLAPSIDVEHYQRLAATSLSGFPSVDFASSTPLFTWAASKTRSAPRSPPVPPHCGLESAVVGIFEGAPVTLFGAFLLHILPGSCPVHILGAVLRSTDLANGPCTLPEPSVGGGGGDGVVVVGTSDQPLHVAIDTSPCSQCLQSSPLSDGCCPGVAAFCRHLPAHRSAAVRMTLLPAHAIGPSLAWAVASTRRGASTTKLDHYLWGCVCALQTTVVPLQTPSFVPWLAAKILSCERDVDVGPCASATLSTSCAEQAGGGGSVETRGTAVVLGAVVVALGPMGAGKSVFCRTLANALTTSSRGSGVCGLLDLDLGQPEVGLPGCVTLSVMDAARGPVFTPPWAAPTAHWRSPLRPRDASRGQTNSRRGEKQRPLVLGVDEVCCCTDEGSTGCSGWRVIKTHWIGKTSVQGCADLVLEACGSLVSDWVCWLSGNALSSSCVPLLVNTHGWIKGAGFRVTAAVISMLKPSLCVALGVDILSAESPDLLKSLSSDTFLPLDVASYPLLLASRLSRLAEPGAAWRDSTRVVTNPPDLQLVSSSSVPTSAILMGPRLLGVNIVGSCASPVANNATSSSDNQSSSRRRDLRARRFLLCGLQTIYTLCLAGNNGAEVPSWHSLLDILLESVPSKEATVQACRLLPSLVSILPEIRYDLSDLFVVRAGTLFVSIPSKLDAFNGGKATVAVVVPPRDVIQLLIQSSTHGSPHQVELPLNRLMRLHAYSRVLAIGIIASVTESFVSLRTFHLPQRPREHIVLLVDDCTVPYI